MFFDMQYMIFVMVPTLILAGLASLMVKVTFNRYSKVPSYSGLTGAQAAERMLRSNGIYDVTVEETSGFLSDHYDPSKKVLRLSAGVYQSNSLSAVGIACHEAGHAMQHAQAYAFLGLRSAMVPMVSFCSWGSYLLIMIGGFMQARNMIMLGALLFAAVVAFAFVTLPVEWDASRRAKQCMVASRMVGQNEAGNVSAVLNAAFLTYVASAVTALITLLYYLWRLGLIGGGRRDD